MNAKLKARELITKFDEANNPKVHALMCVDELIKHILDHHEGKNKLLHIDYWCDVKEEIVKH